MWQSWWNTAASICVSVNLPSRAVVADSQPMKSAPLKWPSRSLARFMKPILTRPLETPVLRFQYQRTSQLTSSPRKPCSPMSRSAMFASSGASRYWRPLNAASLGTRNMLACCPSPAPENRGSSSVIVWTVVTSPRSGVVSGRRQSRTEPSASTSYSRGPSPAGSSWPQRRLASARTSPPVARMPSRSALVRRRTATSPRGKSAVIGGWIVSSASRSATVSVGSGPGPSSLAVATVAPFVAPRCID
jgi:hypothetical protein